MNLYKGGSKGGIVVLLFEDFDTRVDTRKGTTGEPELEGPGPTGVITVPGL